MIVHLVIEKVKSSVSVNISCEVKLPCVFIKHNTMETYSVAEVQLHAF